MIIMIHGESIRSTLKEKGGIYIQLYYGRVSDSIRLNGTEESSHLGPYLPGLLRVAL